MRCILKNLQEKKKENKEGVRNFQINDLNNYSILHSVKCFLNIYFDTWIYCIKILINKKLAT